MLTPQLPVSVPKDNPEYGRLTIYTDEAYITAANVVEVLSRAMTIHQLNHDRIDYLWKYYKGRQPILNRVKTVREEINNKIVVNRAHEIVDFHTGYIVGEQIQYVSHSGDGDDDLSKRVNQLNDYMSIEDKAAKDRELSDWMHIAGTGYRIVLPTEDREPDHPFEIFVPDPRYTFVVYSSKLGHKPMLGVQLVIREDGKEEFSCYTDREYFVICDGVVKDHGYHIMGMIPVIEYPLNTAKLGSFQIVLPLLDAINSAQSDRLDGVDQFIQSFIKFINCDVDEETFESMKQLGAIKVKTMVQGMPADVEIITSELDQGQTQVLVDDLYQSVCDICGLPRTGNGNNSDSSNNGAVVLKNGWQGAETRAKATELMFKQSERKMLKAVLRCCAINSGLELKLTDIDIAFTRRNYSDLLTKSQVLTTMLATDKVHPQLAFAHCGLFVDPETAYAKSKVYAEEQEAKAQEQQEKQMEAQAKVASAQSGGNTEE